MGGDNTMNFTLSRLLSFQLASVYVRCGPEWRTVCGHSSLVRLTNASILRSSAICSIIIRRSDLRTQRACIALSAETERRSMTEVSEQGPHSRGHGIYKPDNFSTSNEMSQRLQQVILHWRLNCSLQSDLQSPP
jgi:hypothetical protein